VTSSHHSARRFKKDSKGAITIETAGLAYHDDSGVEALAKKVGEVIDWSKPDSK